MPVVTEELARLQKMVADGKGEAHCTPCIIPGEERARRVANKAEKTRFILETNSPHDYSVMHAGVDKAIRAIGNRTVAVAVLAHLWARATEDELRELAKGNWT